MPYIYREANEIKMVGEKVDKTKPMEKQVPPLPFPHNGLSLLELLVNKRSAIYTIS